LNYICMIYCRLSLYNLSNFPILQMPIHYQFHFMNGSLMISPTYITLEEREACFEMKYYDRFLSLIHQTEMKAIYCLTWIHILLSNYRTLKRIKKGVLLEKKQAFIMIDLPGRINFLLLLRTIIQCWGDH
jgi:hypothetical protein